MLEKLFTTYTGVFKHLYDRKSREIFGKPFKGTSVDLSQGLIGIIELNSY